MEDFREGKKDKTKPLFEKNKETEVVSPNFLPEGFPALKCQGLVWPGHIAAVPCGSAALLSFPFLHISKRSANVFFFPSFLTSNPCDLRRGRACHACFPL